MGKPCRSGQGRADTLKENLPVAGQALSRSGALQDSTRRCRFRLRVRSGGGNQGRSQAQSLDLVNLPGLSAWRLAGCGPVRHPQHGRGRGLSPRPGPLRTSARDDHGGRRTCPPWQIDRQPYGVANRCAETRLVVDAVRARRPRPMPQSTGGTYRLIAEAAGDILDAAAAQGYPRCGCTAEDVSGNDAVGCWIAARRMRIP